MKREARVLLGTAIVFCVYVLAFLSLKQHPKPQLAGYFNTCVQVAFDVAATLQCALLLHTNKLKDRTDRALLIMLTLASGLMALVNFTWGMLANIQGANDAQSLNVVLNRIPYLVVLLVWVLFWAYLVRPTFDRIGVSLLATSIIFAGGLFYLFTTYLHESLAGASVSPNAVWDYLYIGLELLGLVLSVTASASTRTFPVGIGISFVLLVCADLSFNAAELTNKITPSSLAEIPWTLSQILLLYGTRTFFQTKRTSSTHTYEASSGSLSVAAILGGPIIIVGVFTGLVATLLSLQRPGQLAVMLMVLSGMAITVNASSRHIAQLLGFSQRLNSGYTGDVREMKILFMAANPATTSPLDLEEEIRQVERELEAVKARDLIKFVPKVAVTPDDLVKHLRREKPAIVHFSGHGSHGGIALRSDTGGYQLVAGHALRQLLDARGVELVVLNACYSDGQANDISTVVRAVVGTADAVDDAAARRFSVAFYRTLGDGLPVRDAFRDGCDAVVVHGLTDVFRCCGDLDYTPLREPHG